MAAFLDDFDQPDDHDEETGANARCVFCDGAMPDEPDYYGSTPICDRCNSRLAVERCARCGVDMVPRRYLWLARARKIALCADDFRRACGLVVHP